MKLFLLTLLLLFGYALSNACDITVTTDKEKYSINDTAVLTVTVDLTHGRCTRETIEPVITPEGVTVHAKTAYKKNDKGLYEIKYKLTITHKKAHIKIDKVCPKGGDSTTLTFKVQ